LVKNTAYLLDFFIFGTKIPNMKIASSKALSAAVVRILTPLVRILLRNGVPYGAFADMAKQVYVDLAVSEFQLPGRATSISRAAIITGLSRKEVKRVSELPVQENIESGVRYNRAARVISGWRRDTRFQDGEGQPALLSIQTGSRSFHELVKEYSGDVPARAVLDELLQVGAIEKVDKDQVRLLKPAYIPAQSDKDKLNILGADVSALISTIDHNLTSEKGKAFFQRKVAYDNLSEEAVNEFRPLAAERSQELLELLDAWLAVHDRDESQVIQGTGRKQAGIGIYYFEHDYEQNERIAE
jgi:hypothetical protein